VFAITIVMNWFARVKWDSMRPQCSTWESCIQRIGLNLVSKGVLDNYSTKVLVKDVVKRFKYLENNDMRCATCKMDNFYRGSDIGFH
jgi:hypothetical protein